jgi:predicted TIM-barrel fold metal-dependent hydrolase
MDKMGIRTAVLYPNYGGLKAAKFAHIRNGEVAIAHLRAYNDFELEWSSNYPNRFVPMLVVPFWDVPAAVVEIERMAGNGFGGIVTTGAPQAHGEPYLADRRWDPMWEACLAAGLSVSFHIGGGNTNQSNSSQLEAIMPRASHLGYSSVPHMLDNGKIVLDLLLSGVLNRYPTLKFVSVESGLGWVPFVLEAADYHFKKAQLGVPANERNDQLPSDLFHRQVYVNYWFEELTQPQIDAIGVDNILFETDFPHRTCLEEADVERALQGLLKFDTLTQQKVLWRNAAALYDLSME